MANLLAIVVTILQGAAALIGIVLGAQHIAHVWRRRARKEHRPAV